VSIAPSNAQVLDDSLSVDESGDQGPRDGYEREGAAEQAESRGSTHRPRPSGRPSQGSSSSSRSSPLVGSPDDRSPAHRRARLFSPLGDLTSPDAATAPLAIPRPHPPQKSQLESPIPVAPPRVALMRTPSPVQTALGAAQAPLSVVCISDSDDDKE
jgi:hypothetical protein